MPGGDRRNQGIQGLMVLFGTIIYISVSPGLCLFLNLLEFSSLYPKGDMQFPHFLRKSFAATLIVFSSFAFLSMVSIVSVLNKVT